MADTNITTEQEQIVLREIRRNSSKQIVSYTLDEDSDKQYGFVKVPAVRLDYDTAVYNRTMDGITNELITPIPNDPPEIIEQKFVSLGNIYYAQNNQLVNFNDSLVEEEEVFEDLFSGRYELTPNAASYRGAESPGYYDNTHFSGISYHNGDVRNATDNFILFPGFKEILWDKAVYGPPLDNGGYRVTKELIESGASLNLRAVIGFSLQKDTQNLNAKVRIIRKRIPNDPENVVAGPNGGTYTSPKWPMIQIVLDIPNEDLVEHDLYEIQTIVDSRVDGVHIMGDKCIFEVTAIPADVPTIVWPDPPPGSSPTNTGASTLEESAAAQSDAS